MDNTSEVVCVFIINQNYVRDSYSWIIFPTLYSACLLDFVLLVYLNWALHLLFFPLFFWVLFFWSRILLQNKHPSGWIAFGKCHNIQFFRKSIMRAIVMDGDFPFLFQKMYPEINWSLPQYFFILFKKKRKEKKIWSAWLLALWPALTRMDLLPRKIRFALCFLIYWWVFYLLPSSVWDFCQIVQLQHHTHWVTTVFTVYS